MRVDKTSGFLPEGILLLEAVITDVHGLTALIDALTVNKERYHQLAQGILTGFELGLLPGLDGIEQGQRIVFREDFLIQADQVSDQLAGGFLINTVDLLVAGVGDLLGILGNLDLGQVAAVILLNRGQFVNAAEGRVVLGCDQVRTYAPGTDGGTLGLQGRDQVLIQIIGSGDHGIFKACRVQHLSGFLGQIGKVAAVQTDAVALELYAFVPQILEGLDGIGHAGFQGIIGIDQQDAGGRIHIRVGLEGCQLILKAHDPAVRVGASDRYFKELAAEDIGSADTAGDDSCPGTVGTGVGALGTAQTEFHNAVTLRRVADPGGLGGDQALMVDDIEDGGLDQLRLHDGSNNFHHGFPGEHEGTFRNSVNGTGKVEIGQVVQEILIEDSDAAQIFDISVTEVELLDVIDQLLDAAHDRITAAKRIGTEESVKDNVLVLVLVLEISLHHC